MKLANAHCLVTGASRGIGEAIARELASRGARVTCVARDTAAIERLAAEIGGTSITADLADPSQVASLIDWATAMTGPVDVLVNNAGIDVTKPFQQATAAEIDRIHQINLVAPIQLCRQVIPTMIESGGHIVNVSSMASAGGFPGLALYCSTKAGLSHFTRVVRQDLKHTNVGLTAVEIGPVPTDMLNGMEFQPTIQSFARLRRMQLMPNVTVGRIAKATADAIEKEKRSVWLPTRAAVFPILSGLPQRIVEPLLWKIG
jgi:uncharacterized protein